VERSVPQLRDQRVNKLPDAIAALVVNDRALHEGCMRPHQRSIPAGRPADPQPLDLASHITALSAAIGPRNHFLAWTEDRREFIQQQLEGRTPIRRTGIYERTIAMAPSRRVRNRFGLAHSISRLP
jgi:hypothetical protein